jgi:hypothetical protein
VLDLILSGAGRGLPPVHIDLLPERWRKLWARKCQDDLLDEVWLPWWLSCPAIAEGSPRPQRSPRLSRLSVDVGALVPRENGVTVLSGDYVKAQRCQRRRIGESALAPLITSSLRELRRNPGSTGPGRTACSC